MAYSAFGKQFGESFRQAWKSAEERDEKEIDRKARVAETIEREKRNEVRAAEARLQDSLSALRKRAKGPLGEALIDQRIPTIPSDEQLPSMRITGPDVEGEAYRELTPMEAVKSGMPQGEPDTIENVRAQQSYLAGIEGAERKAAARPEAEAAALLRQESELKAIEALRGRETAVKVRNFEDLYRAQQAEYGKTRKIGAEREGRVRLARQTGSSGQPFTVVTETIAEDAKEGKLGGELHNAWVSGQKEYLKSDYAGRVQRSITKGIADLDAGFTPVNPWQDPADKDARLQWDEMLDIARLKDPIKLNVAIKKSSADLLKMKTDRESLMKEAQNLPEFYAAQQEFDKWVKGVVSRIPTAGGVAPTVHQIAAEAVSRGVNPAAFLTTASNRMGVPQFRDLNYRNLLKLDQGWFTSADLAETKQGGKPVGYNTAFTALRTAERKGDLEVAAQLKKDTATAVRLLDLYNGDLNAMAAAGVSPSVFKIAEDVVHRVGAEAASRVLGDKKTSGMKFEEALKFMNLPANTPYITEPLPSGEPQTIVINSATGPKTVEIFYGTRFHPNLGRNLTPAEIKAAKDERKKRSGFSRNNALSKQMGFDVWDIVE